MGYVKENQTKHFVPAGQTTQLIIGATPESDLKILKLSEGLYQKLSLKRVYYSAYVSVNSDKNLPTLEAPPLLRENRLYQADWLLRFYGFKVNELLDDMHPNFNHILDPKCELIQLSILLCLEFLALVLFLLKRSYVLDVNSC